MENKKLFILEIDEQHYGDTVCFLWRNTGGDGVLNALSIPGCSLITDKKAIDAIIFAIKEVGK